MAKKKPPLTGKPRKDRLSRVRNSLADQLDVLAGRNATDYTEELNRAVRELLIRENLWPASPVAAAATLSEPFLAALRTLLEREGLWPPAAQESGGASE